MKYLIALLPDNYPSGMPVYWGHHGWHYAMSYATAYDTYNHALYQFKLLKKHFSPCNVNLEVFTCDMQY